MAARRLRQVLCLFIATSICSSVPAQQPGFAPGTQPAEELISLNFPDNCELKLLIQYVSDRLAINILYDDQAVAQRITIKSPTRIPKTSLLGLLNSTLKMKGLMLVEGDQPNWKRVVPVSNLQSVARPSTQPIRTDANNDSAPAVAQVFPLVYADAQRIEPVVRPFLTTPGGSIVTLADQHLLIVTDYAPVVAKVADLIKLIDQPGKNTEVKFVAAKFVDAQTLVQQLTQYLTASQKQQGSQQPDDAIEIFTEPRTNRVVLIGSPAKVKRGLELLEQTDIAMGTVTRYYPLKSASPQRIDRLAKELVKSQDLAKTYSSVIDGDANLLIVTGSDAVQTQIAALVQNLDQPQAAAEESPIRFYKLQNATASDVITTINGIEGQDAGSDAAGLPDNTPQTPLPTLSDAKQPQLPGANRPTAPAGQESSSPPIYHNTNSQGTDTPAVAAQRTPAGQTIRTKGGTITSDPNTNTIIVVAKPQIQKVYEQLIRALDKRRPQVLIEATIVTLDTTDSFSLGVELSVKGSAGQNDILTFSSFGLSDTKNTASTGQLALIPGTGFNGTVLNSSIGSAVVQALVTSGHAKVYSAPRILVNDNATGNLSSVSESPYNSINASQTVSTTSFAGYASAGTTVTVTPHIAEGEHLQLEYSVSLNNFTGAGADGLPPPRQTDSISSQVTIPDGSVIVVGGLNRINASETIQRVPILGQIPVLKYLFSSRSTSNQNITLFVFLRPVVLRDDQFSDLKYLSGKDVKLANVEGDIPDAMPMLME